MVTVVIVVIIVRGESRVRLQQTLHLDLQQAVQELARLRPLERALRQIYQLGQQLIGGWPYGAQIMCLCVVLGRCCGRPPLHYGVDGTGQPRGCHVRPEP
jgi:hypothetical protein